MLTAWGAVAAKLKAGKITKEEYDRWRYRYPCLLYTSLVVCLRVADVCIFHSCVSCAGTVNTVASCHRQFTS